MRGCVNSKGGRTFQCHAKPRTIPAKWPMNDTLGKTICKKHNCTKGPRLTEIPKIMYVLKHRSGNKNIGQVCPEDRVSSTLHANNIPEKPTMDDEEYLLPEVRVKSLCKANTISVSNGMKAMV